MKTSYTVSKPLPATKKKKIKSDTEKLLIQFDEMKTIVSDGSKQIKPILEKAKNKIDSMSEMDEMESLRLQMAMDRLSKMMSTLSNILKKMSDTQQSIVQNIK